MATTNMMPTKRFWKLQEFVAHGQSVNCLALGRRSGRVMVTGGEDKKVNLWAIGKPNCIMSLSGHTTAVECVKFGHSDDLVCAGSVSGALKIWDLEAAKILRTLTGHKSNVKCLDFHPYGDFLASGSVDTMIKLWDVRRKGCVYTYKGHNKSVNSVIFSPDGRWIASGGEDGTVKLWDLPAGKMLAEFQGHNGPITDVQYHPNEFLLASSSGDKCVKFWDLESFNLVSSNDNELGVRCIHFNSEGDCLFAGAQDTLKVYGWEPARTYDSLVMGWGKVADMVTSQQQQLIAGAFSLTNVSVYIVDLKRVQPFWSPPNKTRLSQQHSSQAYINSTSSTANTFSTGTHMRRSFSRGHPATDSVEMKMMEDTDFSAPEVDPGDDKDSFADIKQEDDYNEIFHPRKELCRTPPKDDPFPPPLEDSKPLKSKDSHPVKIIRPERSTLSKSGSAYDVSKLAVVSTGLPPAVQQSLNNLQQQRTNFQTQSSHINTVYTKNNNNSSSDLSSRTVTVNPTVLTNAVKPMEKKNHSSLRQSTLESTSTMTSSSTSAISIVRPVISEQPQMMQRLQQQQQLAMQHQNHQSLQMQNQQTIMQQSQQTMQIQQNQQSMHLSQLHSMQQQQSIHHIQQQTIQQQQQAVVFPEQQNRLNANYSDFVPQQRDQPVGLEMDEFLPRHLQENLRIGGSPQVQVSEAEAICSISQGHQQMAAVLAHRRKNLQIILAQWTTKDSKTALESAIQMNNSSLMVDILNVITLRPALWSLDFCQLLLPTIYELLQSKYEAYMAAGCNSLKVILKNFASMIKSNITAPPGVGVDITREERYNKCMSCYNQLLSIRAFLLKRQTMQGKLGQSFRELHILMQALE